LKCGLAASAAVAVMVVATITAKTNEIRRILGPFPAIGC
jgi:hypothetical protein